MKKTFLIPVILLAASALPMLTSCDGDAVDKEDVKDIPNPDRGIEEGVDSLPYYVNTGDRFEFEESGRAFELGIWDVTSAAQLRQREIDTDPEWLLSENQFLYVWETQINELRPQDAYVYVAPEHTFTREGDFIPWMTAIVNSGAGPGSLNLALADGNTGPEQRDQRIIEAVTSVGILAVDHPDFGLCVRRDLSITFENPVVTIEADGSGSITGTYTATESWQAIWPNTTGLDLAHNPITGADIIDDETTSGIFTYYFDSVEKTFNQQDIN